MKAIQKGFSLIELMIVIAIIGVLAAIAVPNYESYTTKARITSNIFPVLSAMLQSAQEAYSENSGTYPSTLTTPYGNLPFGVDVPISSLGPYIERIRYDVGTTPNVAQIAVYFNASSLGITSSNPWIGFGINADGSVVCGNWDTTGTGPYLSSSCQTDMGAWGSGILNL